MSFLRRSRFVQALRLMGARIWYWGSIRTWPPATATLIGLNTLVFCVINFGWGVDVGTLHRFGAYLNLDVWRGEVWRLVTPMFLHANWMHLILNMLGMVLICGDVERSLGSWPYLTIYMISGIVGCAASGVFPPESLSVGASGAIYGVAGVYIAATLGRVDLDGAFRIRTRALVGLMAVLAGLEIALAGLLSTDLAGHFGGLATGLWFAFLVLPPRQGYGLGALKLARVHPVITIPPTNGTRPPVDAVWFEPRPVWEDRWDRRKLTLLAVGSLLICGLVVYDIFPVGNPRYQLYKLDQPALSGDLETSRAGYARRLARNPDDAEIRFRLAVVARLQGDPKAAWEQLDELTRVPKKYGADPLRLFLWALGRSDCFEELSRLARGPEQGPRKRLRELGEALGDPQVFLADPQLKKLPAWEMRNNLAWLRAMLGLQLESALADARKSVAQREDAANLDTLGWIQAKLGMLEDAARTLKRALAQGSFSGGHFHLGTVLSRQGKQGAAAEQFRLALALRGDGQISFADLLAATAALR